MDAEHPTVGLSLSELAGSKTKPLVSVIIPTRNRAYCLPRALDSIYAQEQLGQAFDLEVIVIDDASTDATHKVIERYPGVNYIRLSGRRGVSASMNEGLRVSRGVYITFLGDDDEWFPQKLRVQVPLLVARPDVGVVYGQTIVRNGEEESLFPTESQARSGLIFLRVLMDHLCCHHACFLARRTAFDRAGHFDESLESYEDWDMSLRLALHAKFQFIPGAVDVYNLSPQGVWLTRAASGAGAEDAARVLEKALRTLPDSAQFADLKRQARARLALGTATRIADPAQACRKVWATLREYPESLANSWAHWAVTVVLKKLFVHVWGRVWAWDA